MNTIIIIFVTIKFLEYLVFGASLLKYLPGPTTFGVELFEARAEAPATSLLNPNENLEELGISGFRFGVYSGPGVILLCLTSPPNYQKCSLSSIYLIFLLFALNQLLHLKNSISLNYQL